MPQHPPLLCRRDGTADPMQCMRSSAMPSQSKETWLPLVVLLAASGLVGSVNSAQALECPDSHSSTTPMALKETAPAIKEYSDLLAAQGTASVPGIIFRLKRKYPDASDAEVTNYLVTLYCPVVDKSTGLSDDQKKARIAAFSMQIMQDLAKP